LWGGRWRRWSQGSDDPLPQALRAPEAIASIGGVPFAALGRHFTPGRGRAQHPEDAAEDRAMGVTWASGRRFLGWPQRGDTDPRGVSAFPPRQGQEDGWGRGCGPLTGRARAVAALGSRLRDPPPVRPAQQKGPPRVISGARERERAYLGHAQRDHLWRVRGPPFFPPVFSAWRATTLRIARAACASRQRVIWRCPACQPRPSS
jgi:hypothetical protein